MWISGNMSKLAGYNPLCNCFKSLLCVFIILCICCSAYIVLCIYCLALDLHCCIFALYEVMCNDKCCTMVVDDSYQH